MPFDKVLQLEVVQSRILKPLTIVDNPETEKSCQADLLTLVDCERQSRGVVSNYNPLEYFKIAADFAISDTLTQQCAAGNIDTLLTEDNSIAATGAAAAAAVISAPPSCRLVTKLRTGQQDACTQIINWNQQQDNYPSQSIEENKFGKQCLPLCP